VFYILHFCANCCVSVEWVFWAVKGWYESYEFLMNACVSGRAVFFGMCIDFFQVCDGMWYLNSLVMYMTNWTWFFLLFSLYRVCAEGKFHLFTCIKNGNKEILHWIELNFHIDLIGIASKRLLWTKCLVIRFFFLTNHQNDGGYLLMYLFTLFLYVSCWVVSDKRFFPTRLPSNVHVNIVPICLQLFVIKYLFPQGYLLMFVLTMFLDVSYWVVSE
jgi:hypothetical protein